MVDRREFLLAAASVFATAAFSPQALATESGGTVKEADHDMGEMPANWVGKEQIAMLIYPQFTALDMIGPQYMLSGLMGATVHLVAKTRAPVVSDSKVTFVPSLTFDECPKDLDVLFVPGGTSGTLAAMQDPATLAFLADRGSRAKYVTSVCTGSLVLAAAGLLKGYRATSHWATRELRAEFGAIPEHRRVVFDRNRVTGAGVTAGIDFGLALVEKMRDTEYAKSLQLLAEYDPMPPLDAGSPEKAGEKITKMMSDMVAGFTEQVRQEARRTRKS